jgi:hypothetical protein
MRDGSARVPNEAVQGEPEWTKPNSSKLALAWGVLRLPLILAVLFLLRRQIFAVVLNVMGLERPTFFAIDLLSTPASRGVFFLTLVILLLLCIGVTRRMSLTTAYLVTVFVGWALVALTFFATSRSMPFTVPALALLATNLAPETLYRRVLSSRRSRSMLMMIGLGVGELFFLGRYIRWIVWLATGRSWSTTATPRWLWALPGILLAAGTSAVLLKGGDTVPLEQAIRLPANVRIVARDDFNWVQTDAARHYLYAIGYDVDHLLRYDVTDWSAPPIESEVSTGGSQSFTYDPESQELYVFEDRSNNLLYFDAATLKLKRSVNLPDVSPGDTWLAFDARTGTISIASEADEETGSPFVVVDRASGTVVDQQKADAGNLLLDPQKSLEYLSFFRRTSAVELYDLQRKAIVRRTEIGERAERMAMLESSNELLVTLPMESRIARLDAATLEVKGYISALFGVRAIAVDKGRNLLLCGSIASGRVIVIDLATGRRRASYYLGPWLRTIELVPERGIAYVSSNGAIYEIHYD